ITGAGGEDYYAAFFEMANGATANEWFSELRNVDGGHYPRLHLQVLQGVLQHDGIHHGREHADVISRGAIHIAGAGRDAAENVSAADHQRDFEGEIVELLNFFSDGLGDMYVDTECLFADQRLAGDF